MQTRDEKTTNAIIPLCIVEGDDEPRIRDLDVAEKLGFSRSRDFRKLVKNNLTELSRYGEIRATVTRNGKINELTGAGPGAPATVYMLNEQQALLMCMFSNTPKAADVREAVIKAYVEWRRGPATIRGELELTRAEIAALRSDVAELRTVRDERIACQTGMTIYDIADKFSVVRKGRGREISRMRSHLMRWCERYAITWRLAPMHVFRRHEEVFPIASIESWWRTYTAWKAERDAVKTSKELGQGVLMLNVKKNTSGESVWKKEMEDAEA